MKNRFRLNRCTRQFALFSLASSLLFAATSGYSQEPYFKGKVITVIQSREAGGSGDPRARAVTKFLQKYIPGNPTIVHEYMPGGGGLKAANHMYTVARPDGLTVGSVNATGMLGAAVFGGIGVQYDMQKFIYLGPPTAVRSLCFSPGKRPASAVWKSFERRQGSESPRRQSATTTTTSGAWLLTW